jgi:hypothetical protein
MNKKMKSGKIKYLFATLIIGISFSASAFDPFESGASPTNAAVGYIKSLGFNTNEPQELPDGSYAVFLTGIADIMADPDNPSFIASRRIAYDRAVLNAKANFAKFLERKVRGEISFRVKEGDFPAKEDLQSNSVGNTVIDYVEKANMLLMAKLDSALEEQGVDVRSIQEKSADREAKLKEAEELAEKTLSSAEFSRAIELTANRFVAGVQILGVFEDFSPGETKGTIAVAAVYSDKTLKIAQAMLRNNPSLAPAPNILNPGMSIEETIKDMGKGLLTFQGAKLITNEKGEPVILSFAHSHLPKDTTRSKMNAIEKADLTADQYIDQFVGEMTSAFAKLEESETFLDLVDGEHYNYEEGFATNQAAKFGGSPVSGVYKIVDWVQPHPLTQQKIVGVIKAWSPTSAVLSGLAKKGELSKKEEPQEDDSSSSEAGQSSSETTKIKEEYSSSGTSKNVDF